jgi:hypothetical protein
MYMVLSSHSRKHPAITFTIIRWANWDRYRLCLRHEVEYEGSDLNGWTGREFVSSG